MTTSTPFGQTYDVERLREDFPILKQLVHGDRPLVYLDNAASTQRPRAVIQAMVDSFEQTYANVHRGIHWLSEASTEQFEAARETVRRFINARSHAEVIFTSGATMGINLVARSWGDANVKAGDEILLTEMEHHSNIVPWQQLAARTGAKVRFLPITDNGLLRIDLLEEYLTSRTKVFAFTAVSNVLGTINPVRELVAKAKSVDAMTLVDAAQSVPHDVTDVQSLDCDFLAFSGHKMLGPTGIGVLYGKQELLEAMPPFLGGGSMIGEVTTNGFTSAALPQKFEAGTPPIVEAIGLAEAIRYLEKFGLSQIHQHEQSLAKLAQGHLEEIEGIRFLGPSPDQKAGIVTFTLDGVAAHDIAAVLDSYGVAIRASHHCAMPLHDRCKIAASNRASFYLYNTEAEVAQLRDAILAAKSKFAKQGRKRVSKPPAQAV